MLAGSGACTKALVRKPQVVHPPAAGPHAAPGTAMEPAACAQPRRRSLLLCQAARDPLAAEAVHQAGRARVLPGEAVTGEPSGNGAQAERAAPPEDAPVTWAEPGGAAAVAGGGRQPRAATSMAVHAVASPAVALGAAALFLLTAFDVFGGAPFGLPKDSLHLLPRYVDGPVHAWVRADVPAEVRWAVAEKVISDVAIVSGVAGWAACGCAVLVQSPQRGLPRVGAALASLLALGGDAVTRRGDVLGVEQLKQFFHRARPSDLHHTYAFPSGHTTAATFIVGALLFVALPLCAPALAADDAPSAAASASDDEAPSLQR